MPENRRSMLHISFNNHRKDAKIPKVIEACQQFENPNHVFYKHVKLILIENLNNMKNTSTGVLKKRLKE